MNQSFIRASLEQGAPSGAALLFPSGGQAAFWRRVGTADDYAAMVAEIKSEGSRLLEEPIPELRYSLFKLFETTGNRLAYERLYFEKRRRLNTMTFLALLEPDDERYREALHDAIWSICNEYTWCLPAHLRGSTETDGEQAFAVDSPEWSRRERGTSIDLFSAETGFALAEILCLLGSELPPLLRSRMTEEIVQRLFKPYLRQGPFGWETVDNNWAAVCAGSVASAALLLLDDSRRLAEIVEKALVTMEHYLSGFGDDGACLEGIGYWNYGFGYFVYFADLLERRTRGRLDLFRTDDARGGKIRQIALFQQKAYLDGDTTVNFSDSAQHYPVQIGLSHYLAARYPETAPPPNAMRAPYTDDHCSRWAHAFRNLLWFDPQKNGGSWADGDYYLPHAQWLVSRCTTAAGRFGFAAKAGHNGEPHNHNDIGQFILTGDGKVFLSDLGSGEYTADYFGPGRYGFDCNGSQGHSVPIVDGAHQSAGTSHAAREVTASTGEREDGLRFEMADAYDLPYLASLERQLVWRKLDTPVLELEDAYRFTSMPTSIVERIVSRIKPAVEANVVTLQSEAGLRLAIAYDAQALRPNVQCRTMNDHYGAETDWYAIDFAVLEPRLDTRVRLTFRFE
ncbi:hypothetical protein GXP70_21110 [Paenibacillus lycopersici]|uniref:Heparinase II/III-like C-terminal domain-containing protein n=1 Tax=Paenibacillus lycopersici TaxID=2704462 RepID=A0A6C0G1H3_9BACL|nr:heparinase II/III family protein [Paenibacillus lycopersici]QHT62232.1 hypothetical protein GXP70_21110 [Paenibacillus lycopersici]